MNGRNFSLTQSCFLPFLNPFVSPVTQQQVKITERFNHILTYCIDTNELVIGFESKGGKVKYKFRLNVEF